MKSNFYAFARHFSVLVFTAITTISTFAQGFSPQTQKRLQRVLDSFQNNPANPYIGGMSAAITVDGLAQWQGATGYAARNIDASNNLLPGGTPFKIETLSRIYSITKTFTAALVLELVHEGVFSLSDPVNKFLPLKQINPNLNGNVTIAQLLAHESGYSDFEDEQAFIVAVAYDPSHVWSPYETISFEHQLVAPGTIRRYSNTNYIVLGAIIEAASGKSVAQLFRERFFNPLHLNSMYLAGREAPGNRGTLAAPHDNISPLNPIFQLTHQPTFPDTFTNISRLNFTAIQSIAFTSGGIVSNVADVARWGNDLFSGRATGKAILDQMLQSISSKPDEDGDYLGYGIWRSTQISTKDVFIGHNGSATGYRSVMFYQPERKMTIAILTNFQGAKLYAVAKALYEALPNFICGNDNRSEAKIQLCWNGNSLCVAREAAANFIKRGAYLGSCEGSKKANVADQHIRQNAVQTQENDAMQNTSNVIAYPNPFRTSVDLSFRAAQSGTAALRVYNANGQLVTTLFQGAVQKGAVQKVVWQAGALSSGVYYTQLQTVQGTSRQRVVLQR